MTAKIYKLPSATDPCRTKATEVTANLESVIAYMPESQQVRVRMQVSATVFGEYVSIL